MDQTQSMICPLNDRWVTLLTSKKFDYCSYCIRACRNKIHDAFCTFFVCTLYHRRIPGGIFLLNRIFETILRKILTKAQIIDLANFLNVLWNWWYLKDFAYSKNVLKKPQVQHLANQTSCECRYCMNITMFPRKSKAIAFVVNSRMYMVINYFAVDLYFRIRKYIFFNSVL